MLRDSSELLASSSNSSTDGSQAVTFLLRSSMTALSMAFHLIILVILARQVQVDVDGVRILSQRGQRLVFFAGTICITLGIYLADDNADKLLAVLQEFYHIISGTGVGVCCLVICCWKFLKRYQSVQDLRRLRDENIVEREISTISLEDNDNNDLDRPIIDENALNIPQNRFIDNLAPGIDFNIILKPKQPFLNTFIAIMTFCIVIIEVVFIFGLIGNTNFTDSSNYLVSFRGVRLFYLHNTTSGVYMVQILLQALCYIFLINGHEVRLKFQHSTELFFKYMAFFNFTMVINSLWDCNWKQLDGYDNIKLGEKNFGPGFNILFTIYSSMVVNTRVLFVYLFLEYSHDIEKASKKSLETENRGRNLDLMRNIHPEEPGNVEHANQGRENDVMEDRDTDELVRGFMLSRDDKFFRNIGYCIGLACVILQALMAVHYIDVLGISSWTNIFSVIANMEIIFTGWLMVRRNLKKAPNIILSGGTVGSFVHMLNVLGVLGFIFSFTKLCFSVSLLVNFDSLVTTNSVEYFRWCTVKRASEMITIPFLIVYINIINKLVPVIRNRWDKLDHVLLPALMLGVFGMGLGLALDQYVGDVIWFTRQHLTDSNIQLLLEVGPSILLAFLMDVFFRLLVICSQ